MRKKILIMSPWIFIAISVIASFLAVYSNEYLKTKGQNAATKEDIAEITKKIEDVKATIQKNQEVEKLKRELKYNALLKSLKIIDAYISNHITGVNSVVPDKQYASIEEVRECHNSLILTCDDPETLKLYEKIMFNEPVKDSSRSNNIMIDLVEYRNAVRKELQF